MCDVSEESLAIIANCVAPNLRLAPSSRDGRHSEITRSYRCVSVGFDHPMPGQRHHLPQLRRGESPLPMSATPTPGSTAVVLPRVREQQAAARRAASALSFPEIPFHDERDDDDSTSRRSHRQRGQPPAASTATSTRKAPSVAATNRTQAQLDVVTVGDVEMEDRHLLSEGDKRARRVVYDSLRNDAPEFANGRGRIVPLEITPVVARRYRAPPNALLNFSHRHLADVKTLLSRAPREAHVLPSSPTNRSPTATTKGTAPKAAEGSGPSRGGDNNTNDFDRRRRRHAMDQEARDAEAARTKALYDFGDDAVAFISATKQAVSNRLHPERSAVAISRDNANASSTTTSSPLFRPGQTRLWGAKALQPHESLIIIRERDQTYVIDRDTLEEDEYGMPKRVGGKSDFAETNDVYFHALQVDLVEATPDPSKLVYLMEREARLYQHQLALRRIALNYKTMSAHHGGPAPDVGDRDENISAMVAMVVGPGASIAAIIQAANKLPPAPLYACSHLKLCGNKIPKLNVIGLARTIHFATLPTRMASQAAFVDLRYTAIVVGHSLAPSKMNAYLPLQFLTFLDLSECGLERIEFPSVSSSSANWAGVDVTGHPVLVLSETALAPTPEGVTPSPLDSLVVTKHVGAANVPAKRGSSPTRHGNAKGAVNPHLLCRIPDPPAELQEHVRQLRHDESCPTSSKKKSRGDVSARSDDASDTGSEAPLSRAGSRRVSRTGSTILKRTGNPELPYRGKIAHWTLAPCAPLRFLVTLYLHGNKMQDYREALTFAALSRTTLTTLTWHGNPGIDARTAEATAAARATLPRLAHLNFTKMTAPTSVMEQRSLAKKQ
jgi:hypothetical protein